MLERIEIHGYRSLREFRLRLGRLNVITGKNGVGKSNFYRALHLLQNMASGNFAEAIAREGGMRQALWAGDRRKDEPRRISWEIQGNDSEFAISCGLIPTEPKSKTEFKTDPEIKSESIRLGGKLMAQRKGPTVTIRNANGKMENEALPFFPPESMISAFRKKSDAIASIGDVISSWRFYHQFRADRDSPLRRPQVGFWSPVLAHDGANLACTLQTIRESKIKLLEEITSTAFSDTAWSVTDGDGNFELRIMKPEIRREFRAAELSDGTLRFFCLCAALLSPQPPLLLVLNEPENSLHDALISPLAELIARVPESTQIILVTHSLKLAAEISARCDSKTIALTELNGETRPEDEASAKRVWSFE